MLEFFILLCLYASHYVNFVGFLVPGTIIAIYREAQKGSIHLHTKVHGKRDVTLLFRVTPANVELFESNIDQLENHEDKKPDIFSVIAGSHGKVIFKAQFSPSAFWYFRVGLHVYTNLSFYSKLISWALCLQGSGKCFKQTFVKPEFMESFVKKPTFSSWYFLHRHSFSAVLYFPAP